MKFKKSNVLESENTSQEDREQLQKRSKEEEDMEKLRVNRLMGPNGGFTERGNFRRLNNAQEITQIRPYLYLCGALALRGNALQDLNVTCVVNATNELPDTPLPESNKSDIQYLRVGVDDKADSDILSWLGTVADLIHQVRLSSGKTLVHCVAGISRSASLCLAYLIKYEGYSLHDSYTMLRQLRYI